MSFTCVQNMEIFDHILINIFNLEVDDSLYQSFIQSGFNIASPSCYINLTDVEIDNLTYTDGTTIFPVTNWENDTLNTFKNWLLHQHAYDGLILNTYDDWIMLKKRKLWSSFKCNN